MELTASVNFYMPSTFKCVEKTPYYISVRASIILYVSYHYPRADFITSPAHRAAHVLSLRET